MNFKEQKQLITNALIKSDMRKIAQRAETTPQTVRTTLRLDSLTSATDLQIRIWKACLALLDERRRKAEVIEGKIGELAETMQ